MILSFIFLVLVIFGVGLPISFILCKNFNLIGRFGISYLLGLGIFTLFMYFYSLCGLRFTFLNNVFLLIFLSAVPTLLKRKEILDYFLGLKKSWQKIFGFSKIEKLIVFCFVFIFFSSFIYTLYWPVYSWDSLALYDFRGLSFANTGYMNDAINSGNSGYFWAYPLMTSLSHTIVYLSGGNNPNFLYTLFYISLVVVFYSLVREKSARTFSLFVTLVLATIPIIYEHSLFSYTNLPYLSYFSLGLIILVNNLIDSSKRGDWKLLLLPAVLISLSTWVRSKETFWIAPLFFVFFYSFYYRKYWYMVVYSLIFFPVQQAWKVFQSWGVGSQLSTNREIVSYAGFLFRLDLSRILDVMLYVFDKVILNWGIIFLFFIFSLIFNIFNRKKQSCFFFSIVLFLLVLLFVGTYILSFTYPYWKSIGDSAYRMSMFFYPLFVYAVAFIFAKENNER